MIFYRCRCDAHTSGLPGHWLHRYIKPYGFYWLKCICSLHVPCGKLYCADRLPRSRWSLGMTGYIPAYRLLRRSFQSLLAMTVYNWRHHEHSEVICLLTDCFGRRASFLAMTVQSYVIANAVKQSVCGRCFASGCRIPMR